MARGKVSDGTGSEANVASPDHTKHPFYVFASGVVTGVVGTVAVIYFFIGENYTRTAAIEETLKTQGKVVIAQSEHEKLRRASDAILSRRLRITGVELDLDSEKRTEQALRVIASVNGNMKSYPTDSSWAPQGPDFSDEPFAVTDAAEYSIRFEVWAKDARGSITRFSAPSGQVIVAAQLPARKLIVELQEEGTRARVGGRVRFSIE